MTKEMKILVRRATGAFCLSGMPLPVDLFVSCTEKDSTVEEFTNWQSKNETYWNKLYTATQQRIKSGDASWKMILNYTFQNQKQTSGSVLTYSPEDYITAHVEQVGADTTSPLYSDSVSMHYMDRLIPPMIYTSGLIFDKSWSNDTFNAAISRPNHSYIGLSHDSKGRPISLVDGSTTASMSIYHGDYQTIYILYQLGYDTSALGIVPAYSTLIFDL